MAKFNKDDVENDSNSETALEVAELLSDDTVEISDKVESDGTDSTSGGTSTNTDRAAAISSGYNSNDNAVSTENLNPMSQSFNIAKLKRPPPNDYLELNLETDSLWRHSSGSFSNFIPAGYPGNRQPLIQPCQRQPLETMAEVDTGGFYLEQSANFGVNHHNRQSSYLHDTGRSQQYTYIPPHHQHHHRHQSEKDLHRSSMNRGWRSGFIVLVVSAITILITLVGLGVWKYIIYETDNQSAVIENFNPQSTIQPTNEPLKCTGSVDIDSMFDLRQELQLDEERQISLSPGLTYPLIFSIYSDQTVSLSFEVSPTCRLALIGRREGIPKLSDHHFLDTLVGPFTLEEGRNKAHITRHLNTGRWFVSVINDGEDECSLGVKVSSLATTCPNGCSGNGHCNGEVCDCFEGWSGDDCSVGTCQATCSGNGHWSQEGCVCYNGWKGSWCHVRKDQCESDCVNGDCVEGQCKCRESFTGEACDKPACPKQCSSNGLCIDGRCRCYQGYSGADCATPQPDKCNHNGLFLNSTCHCYPGFDGKYCSILEPIETEPPSPCSSPCLNGGSCYQNADEWLCRCPDDFAGADCGIKVEAACEDGLDNDGNGLTDCLDPACCKAEKCRTSKHCVGTARVKLPQWSQSFQAKLRPLVKRLQTPLSRSLNLAQPLSVLVGTIYDVDGLPVPGVRVSSTYAMSSSRLDGSFHLVFLQGECEKVSFQRDGFRAHSQVECPASEYHSIAPVQLRLVWETDSTLVRSPAPPQINLRSSHAAHFSYGESYDRNEVDSATQKPRFKADVMDGSITLRLVTSYPDKTMLYLSVEQPESPQLLVQVYCRGQLILNRRISGPKVEITALWDQEDYFTERTFGEAECTAFVGAKFNPADNYVWSRKSVPVLAAAPEQLTRSTMGGFRFGFDSVLEPRSGLIYHMDSQRIESVNFNYEKSNNSKTTVSINNLINYYEVNGYGLSVTKNGVYKTKKPSAQKELVANIKILGEWLQDDKLYYVTRAGLHQLDHNREFNSILVKDDTLNGPVTVTKDNDILVSTFDGDILLIKDKVETKITAQDPNSFRVRVCQGGFEKLSALEVGSIRSLTYSSIDNSLVVFSDRLLRVSMNTPDYWTTLVAGTVPGCRQSQVQDDSMLSNFNKVVVSPTGTILASTHDRIYELGENGAVYAVFGSCGENCNRIPADSPAKLTNIVSFSFKRPGVLQLIERVDGKNLIGILRPSKPRKVGNKYEVGFPRENIIRVYALDGRLLQVKDIFTERTIKFLTYQVNRLISVRDQFDNEVKASHMKGRILLQNSANQRRAQITLRESGDLPVELLDDDIEVKFKFNSNDDVTEINGVRFDYEGEKVISTTIGNRTVFIENQSKSGVWSIQRKDNCQMTSWHSGQFYRARLQNGRVQISTADGSLVSIQQGNSYNTEIASLDPITKRPHYFGRILSQVDRAVPDKETSWISIAQDKQYVKRMLKDGNTLMSYDLDYSSEVELMGRFYDETVNILGQLAFDKQTGRVQSSRTQYQKLHSSEHVSQKKFSYYSDGLLKTVEGDVTAHFLRSRSGRLNSISINGEQSFRTKIQQRTIEIRTPEGDLYLLNFDWSNPTGLTKSIEIGYPSGSKFVVEIGTLGDASTTIYKRNGLKFLSVEDSANYRRTTHFEEAQSESVVSLKNCAGEILSEDGDRRYIYEGTLSVGVDYRTGPHFRTDYSFGLRLKDQGQDYFVTYQYDEEHRPLVTQITVLGHSTRQTWQYDKDELKSIDQLEVNTFGDALYDISFGRARMVRKYRPEDQIRKIKRNLIGQLQIDKKHIYEFNFGRQGGLEEYQIATKGSSKQLRHRRTFDQSGRVNATLTEQFIYGAGLLRSVRRQGIEIPIHRDHFLRVLKFGHIRFMYSSTSGALESIGEDILVWSASEQLVSHNGRALYYDQDWRLIQFGEMRLVYGDGQNPERITHSFELEKYRSYYYDASGALVSFIEQVDTVRSVMYVMSNSEGTPLVVFDENGESVEEFERSYHGQNLKNGPEQFLPVGHHGDFCVGHLCRDKTTLRWRQTLTGEGVFFGDERSTLDSLLDTQAGLAFDPVNKIKWPYRNLEHFSLIYSRREKLIEKFLQIVLGPSLPQLTC